MGRRGGGRRDCIDYGGFGVGRCIMEGKGGWDGMDTDRSMVIPDLVSGWRWILLTGDSLILGKPHIWWDV